MGFLKLINALFGGSSTSIKTKDRVWFNRVAKYKGLYQHVVEALQGRKIWVIAYFPESLHEINQILKSTGISYTEVINQSDMMANTDIIMVSADNFMKYAQSQSAAIKPNLYLLTEHYPTYSVDQALIHKINEVNPQPDIYFYIDLDEPFFDLFGGDRIKQLLVKLGGLETEAIEHAMVSRSIVNAQKKIEQKVTINQPTNSQQEWFKKNIKQ